MCFRFTEVQLNFGITINVKDTPLNFQTLSEHLVREPVSRIFGKACQDEINAFLWGFNVVYSEFVSS